MKTDIEIAQSCTLLPITAIGAKLGLTEEQLECYGRYKAKLLPSATAGKPQTGKLILVTAINPTAAGEGKTTTSIGLADSLSALGKKTVLALREPSLGPVFGLKGGATGGGWAQVAPMEDINLHFTGDFHAIGAANNLLAAMVDNHIYQGNALDIQQVTWRRCVDMNDRQLRYILCGLGGKGNGVPREEGFDITVATEVMAVLCLAEDLTDLKARLARMIVGQLTPTEGSIRVGANVNIGYYAQNQDDLMDGDFTVYDTLDRVAVGDIRTRLRDILGAFLFRGEDIDKKVKVLSGGERARLAMARMMLEPRNLLVLDEPTNHMDMRSKDILKNAIMKYDGTVVVVSHDREFLDGMVEKVYEFRDGGVKEYLGGIYYFLEKRKLDSLRDVERKEAPAPAAAPKTEAPKLTYEQKKEQEKLLRKLRRAVESIETELAETERRIADYDARFAAATAYDEADYKAYDDLKAHYDHLMHEWEKASYELEITENG